MRSGERARSGSHAVTLAIGLLVGLLAATLIADDRAGSPVTTTAAGGGLSTTGTDPGLATSDPSPGAGDATPGTGVSPTGGAAGAAAIDGSSAGTPSGSVAPSGESTSSGGGTRATGNGGATARGVTASTVKIGVTIPDLAALGAFPEYNQGNVDAQWKAAMLRLKDEGLLPAHGRDVQLVFSRYSLFIAEEERASCVKLVDDEKVFAVVGMVGYNTGRDCVTREKKTVLVTADGPPDDAFARDAPYLFSLGLSESGYLRNGITWAHKAGLLRDEKIGLFYFKGGYVGPMIEASVKQPLAQFGYKPVIEVTTDQASANQPDILVAVQRMKAAGVTHALIYIDALSRQEFYRQAENQGFKPTYQGDDWGFGTSDSTNQRNQPDQFDGTLAVTTRRVGETRNGGKLDASQTKCLQYYTKLSGRTPELESNEYAYALLACDEAEIIVRGLVNAGPTLTTPTMIRGIEGVRFKGRRYAGMAFGPGRHFGSIEQRTLKWSRTCTCWAANGPFSPLALG